MPLPVIFKFISDTSGSKFDRVIGEMDGVKISSEKAGRAVRSLASILRDGQDPAIALADAMSSLTRAFRGGVVATVAIVAAVEIIKTFIKNAQDMAKVTESLNNAVQNFREQADTLDLSGAVSQIRTLTKELEKARDAAGGGRPEDKLFGTIADVFLGGGKLKAEVAKDATKQALESAKRISKEEVFRSGEIKRIERVNKLEAERLKTIDKYNKLYEEQKKIGADADTLFEIRKQEEEEIIEISQKAQEEELDRVAKEAQLKIEMMDEEKRFNEEIEKQNKRAHDEMLKRINEQKKARDDFYRGGFEGAGTVLDRIKEAAQRQGRDDIIRRIDKERANLQNVTDRLLLENLGKQTGERRFMGLDERQIERERISGFAQMEANLQREQNNRLFSQVDSVRSITQNILEAINDRLGVPILRSAR